ncbi:MAG: 3-oxoacyl-[acyl-carrier-protein] synthase-3 [Chlamydiales bacterium]|jgi:3-oxoacyl-[acyl-carrier-protein] synthase-3
MTELVRVGIAGTGSCLPERVVTNDDFAKIVDTDDEWIQQRTGIRERRFVSEGENTSDLALGAAKQALDAAGVKPEELDLVVLGTLTADYLMPSAATLVQDRLGATNAGAFDVSSACTGFLTALHTAEAFVASGRAKKVLAIGAETLSRYLNLKDRGSCILFGDGAGAAVVTPWSECERGEIIETTLGADGSGFEFIHIPVGGAAIPHDHEKYVKDDHYITLRGRDVYRFAVSKMAEMIQTVTRNIDPDEVAWVVPHQVNKRIIDAALSRVGWSIDRCVVNIDRFGNTSAASVPIALDEAVRDGRIQKGQLIVLVAFGAGLTWGGTLLRW